MIAWLDIETTGLDPLADYPLEVGIIVTDDDLKPQAMMTQVIYWPEAYRDYIEKRLALNDNFTWDMHTKNFLLDEVSGSSSGLALVRMELIEFMRGIIGDGAAPVMGGNSITFDRTFLSHWMPGLLEQFHYRSIDLSSVRELARRWRPDLTQHEPIAKAQHRAYPDLLDSIGLAAFYRQHLFITPETEQE